MNNRERFEELMNITNSLKSRINSILLNDEWYSDRKEYQNLENNVRSLREISGMIKANEYTTDITDIDFFCETVDFCESIFQKIISKEQNEYTIKLLKFIEQVNKNLSSLADASINIKNRLRNARSKSEKEKFWRIWKVVDLVNGKCLSQEEMKALKDMGFEHISKEFIELKDIIFNVIESDYMDECDKKYYQEKVMHFIFEGKDSVKRNRDRNPDELLEYIRLTIPMKFNVEGFLYGLEVASLIEESSKDKENKMSEENISKIIDALDLFN